MLLYFYISTFIHSSFSVFFDFILYSISLPYLSNSVHPIVNGIGAVPVGLLVIEASNMT